MYFLQESALLLISSVPPIKVFYTNFAKYFPIKVLAKLVSLIVTFDSFPKAERHSGQESKTYMVLFHFKKKLLQILKLSISSILFYISTFLSSKHLNIVIILYYS